MFHSMMLVFWWVWSSWALGAEPAAEKVNAWTILGGVRGAVFGLEVQRDLSGCLDGDDEEGMARFCAEPLLLDGGSFRGGLMLRGASFRTERTARLTALSLVDSGKERCARLQTVANNWRNVHKAHAGGKDLALEGYVYAWVVGPVALTYQQTQVTASNVAVHRLYRAEANPGDTLCNLISTDIGAHEMLISGGVR